MVIKVIVHAVAALVPAHCRCRNGTEISEIVVAEHQRYAVKLRIAHESRRLFVAVEIRLDFLVQSKHAGYGIKVLVNVFADELILCL